MTSRLLDIDNARELRIDATARPGNIFLIGKGFCLEFDLENFLSALSRELTHDKLVNRPIGIE